METELGKAFAAFGTPATLVAIAGAAFRWLTKRFEAIDKRLADIAEKHENIKDRLLVLETIVGGRRKDDVLI